MKDETNYTNFYGCGYTDYSSVDQKGRIIKNRTHHEHEGGGFGENIQYYFLDELYTDQQVREIWSQLKSTLLANDSL